jgi:hypothetical protein
MFSNSPRSTSRWTEMIRVLVRVRDWAVAVIRPWKSASSGPIVAGSEPLPNQQRSHGSHPVAGGPAGTGHLFTAALGRLPGRPEG